MLSIINFKNITFNGTHDLLGKATKAFYKEESSMPFIDDYRHSAKNKSPNSIKFDMHSHAGAWERVIP